MIAENKIIPPISRMGGKSKLKEKIIELMPIHTCYVEVFFGAGWVYFSKIPSKCEAINDKDMELVNLFRVLKNHPEELERQLLYEFSSRKKFYEYRDIDIATMTDIQRAARFMYLISLSFGSKGGSYYATTSRPSQKLFKTTDFEKIRQRLENTFVENLDFQDLIPRYDRDHTLFFCDPPYIETEGYQETFKKDDHIRLYETLSAIRGKFILTINDHPLARQLYHKYDILNVETTYSLSKSKNIKAKELIIKNF